MKNIFNLVFLMLFCQLAVGQQIIPLYDDKIPAGSEKLNLPEKSQTDKNGRMAMVYNVSKPTLTVVAPAKGQGNGSAVIICPGGAFRFLSYGSEGYDVANWFVSKGYTAFMLKYRLVPEQKGSMEILFQDFEINELCPDRFGQCALCPIGRS